MGIVFLQQEHTKKLSTPFLFLATILLPSGLFITFYEAGYQPDSAATNSLISGILCATYLSSYFLLRRNFFLLFGIIFGAWLFFDFTSFIINTNNVVLWGWRFYAYRFLVAGLSFVLLGHAFRQQKGVRDLTGFLYCVGLLAALGAALSLGGWEPNQSLIWELLFPGIVFAVVFLGVAFKSKSFLIVGALYVVAYIAKITAEYFTEGLGWPLSLVLIGFVLIAVGYYTYHLNKKYLSA